jgi:hypothetical protein
MKVSEISDALLVIRRQVRAPRASSPSTMRAVSASYAPQTYVVPFHFSPGSTLNRNGLDFALGRTKTAL